MPKRGNEGFDAFAHGLLDYKSPEVWRDHKRVIMASLVEGVYRIERERINGHGPRNWNGRPGLKWWETFHYDMVEPIEANNAKRTVFGAVYKSRLDHNPGHHDLSAPKIVVAFRGTMITNKADFMANIHILFHRLRSHQRYAVGLKVLREQVLTQYHHSEVCLAGHSKGAALALLMGRELAEGEGNQGPRRFLEAHLFNPPHPAIPRTEPSSKLAAISHEAHKVFANALSRALQHNDTRQDENRKFLSIRDWLPHLYVNAQDIICSAYITHFQDDHLLPEKLRASFPELFSATPHSIRGILRSYFLKEDDSRPDHLIPSACLHINGNPPASNFLTKRYKAHKLRLWYDFNLEVYQPLKIQFDPDKDCMVIAS